MVAVAPFLVEGVNSLPLSTLMKGVVPMICQKHLVMPDGNIRSVIRFHYGTDLACYAFVASQITKRNNRLTLT